MLMCCIEPFENDLRTSQGVVCSRAEFPNAIYEDLSLTGWRFRLVHENGPPVRIERESPPSSA